MKDTGPRRYTPMIEVALYGMPDRPNTCPCGSSAPFVDGQNLHGIRGPFFVWCPDCGREGPQRPSYDLALAVWNRVTRLKDYSCIRVVDNKST